MNTLKIITIPWGSALYTQSLALRNDILRKTAGLPFYTAALEEENSCLHIAALYNGHLIGCMHLEKIDAFEVMAKQVAVSEEYQGQGIGAALMHYAEEIAHDNGYQLVSLRGKQNAWKFYERLGYEACGGPFASSNYVVKWYVKNVGVGFIPESFSQRVLSV